MISTRLISSLWYRSKLFWLLLLFVVYSAFGWIGVPLIVKDQAAKTLKELAQWDTTIGTVRFNPYALSLELKQVQIREGTPAEKVLAFERLYVDFDALRSLSGTISFTQVELAEPFVKLAIDAQGVTNFQHTFASGAESPETAEPIKLFFRHIDITRGQVDLFDESQGEPFSLALQPLGLTLKDFHTALNDGGDYALSISLGDDQRLDWSGRIGIAPFQSKGTLALRNILPKTFWHYVKAASPYWLNDARISLKGQYNTAYKDGHLGLQVQNGQLQIKQIALATDQTAPDFFQLAELSVGPIQFDLAQASLALGEVMLDAPELSVVRNANGELDVLTPFASQAKSEETGVLEAEDASADQPFHWQISKLQVNQGQLRWQDQSLRTPADLSIQDIQLQLGALSQDLSQALPYQVNFAINESRHALSGQLTAVPLRVDGDISVQQFPLNWLQSYLSETTKIIVNSGEATFTGRYQIAQEQALTGSITGDLNVDRLALSDSERTERLSGFEQLTLVPISIQLDPLAITIDTMTLSKPYGEAIIAEDGRMNLANLMVVDMEQGLIESGTELNPEQAPEDSSSEPTPEPAHEAPAPTLNIAQLLIEDGRFDFIDASQKPPFQTYVEQLSGAIKGLSSSVEAKSAVALEGSIETYGKLAVSGTFNPLSSKPNSDLVIDISNVDLSSASTYSSRYLGYPIDKGKLTLGLKYQIVERRIDGKNHIIIDQFNLGDAVDSPDSAGLPLPFAIGILSDTRGTIDLKLPVRGDLDDPKFSLGSVIFTAFKNFLTKVITSPFSFLSSLVGGKEDISAVSFAAGEPNLDAEQAHKVLLLADALKSRPNLNLEVRGIADLSIDTPTLKRQRLAQTLLAFGPDPVSSRERLLNHSMSLEEIDTLKANFEVAAPAGQQTDYLAALDGELLKTFQLPDVAFIGLAKARAASVLKALVAQGGIEQRRVFVLEPQVISSGQTGMTVDSKFNVNVR